MHEPNEPQNPAKRNGWSTASDATRALAALGLALLFAIFFMRAKHDVVLGPIIPFADDPADAVGSFAFITALLLGLLAVGRAIPGLWRRDDPGRFYRARTHAAVALAVGLALAGDAVLLARHPTKWWAKPGALDLLAEMAGLGVLAGALLVWARVAGRPRATETPRARRHAWAGAAALALILAAFPERAIATTMGEVAALAAGMASFFVALGWWLEWMLPEPEELTSHRPHGLSWGWAAAMLLGAAIGGLLLLGESREGIRPDRLLLVATLFVGAPAAGLGLAYGCLGRRLGMERRR